MSMTALTLWQPWATLVAIGAKSIETRSWGTNHRGHLAIHAAKKPVIDALSGVAMETKNLMSTLLGQAGWHFGVLPLGSVVATCYLEDCVRAENIRDELTDQERAFGDYSDGRYAWKLRLIEIINPPIFARGSQGLWQWEGFDERTA